MAATLPALRRGRPPGQSHARTGVYVKSPKGRATRTRLITGIVLKVREMLPWLQPCDMAAARSWAEFEYIISLAFTELVQNGLTNRKGDSRRLLTDWRQLKLAQLAYERELGMTPSARDAIRGNGSARSTWWLRWPQRTSRTCRATAAIRAGTGQAKRVPPHGASWASGAGSVAAVTAEGGGGAGMANELSGRKTKWRRDPVAFVSEVLHQSRDRRALRTLPGPGALSPRGTDADSVRAVALP